MKSSAPQRSVIFIRMIPFYRPIYVDRDSNLSIAVAPGRLPIYVDLGRVSRAPSDEQRSSASGTDQEADAR